MQVSCCGVDWLGFTDQKDAGMDTCIVRVLIMCMYILALLLCEVVLLSVDLM